MAERPDCDGRLMVCAWLLGWVGQIWPKDHPAYDTALAMVGTLMLLLMGEPLATPGDGGLV